jgi:hypothetical protein
VVNPYFQGRLLYSPLALFRGIHHLLQASGLRERPIWPCLRQPCPEKDSLNKLPDFWAASRVCRWCGVPPTADIGHYVNFEALAAIELNSNSTGWSTVRVSGITPPLSGPIATAAINLDRKILQPLLGDMKTRTWKERRPDIPLP